MEQENGGIHIGENSRLSVAQALARAGNGLGYTAKTYFQAVKTDDTREGNDTYPHRIILEGSLGRGYRLLVRHEDVQAFRINRGLTSFRIFSKEDQQITPGDDLKLKEIIDKAWADLESKAKT